MIKLDFWSKILCFCDVIFEIKYPLGESEDLRLDPILILPTFIMIPVWKIIGMLKIQKSQYLLKKSRTEHNFLLNKIKF